MLIVNVRRILLNEYSARPFYLHKAHAAVRVFNFFNDFLTLKDHPMPATN